MAPSRTPDHDAGFALVCADLGDGHVRRLYKLALIEHVLEPGIDLFSRNANQMSSARKCAEAFVGISFLNVANPKNDITTAPVVDVVRKRANGLERRLRVPGFLELYPTSEREKYER